MSASPRVALKVAGSALLAFALVLCLTVGFIACGGDEPDTETTAGVATTEAGGTDTTGAAVGSTLVGKWSSEALGETIEFTADGRMLVSTGGEELLYSYATEDGKIVLTLEATEGEGTFPYSISGNTLTIEDPEMGPTTYTRVQ